MGATYERKVYGGVAAIWGSMAPLGSAHAALTHGFRSAEGGTDTFHLWLVAMATNQKGSRLGQY